MASAADIIRQTLDQNSGSTGSAPQVETATGDSLETKSKSGDRV